ncbi:MAG: hypothetical protein L0H83_13230 [Salinisphaera sp.]|nr:hypothetical protein [Nevskiaceae bacterium]MDN5939607.1 hypothetical protein [Salinisphaera sp.]
MATVAAYSVNLRGVIRLRFRRSYQGAHRPGLSARNEASAEVRAATALDLSQVAVIADLVDMVRLVLMEKRRTQRSMSWLSPQIHRGQENVRPVVGGLRLWP